MIIPMVRTLTTIGRPPPQQMILTYLAEQLHRATLRTLCVPSEIGNLH
jgi:hypothetical protein